MGSNAFRASLIVGILVIIQAQDDCDRYTYVTRMGRQVLPGVTRYKSFTTAECMESCNAFRWCIGVQHHLRSGECHLYSHLGVAFDDTCCLVARRRCLVPNRPTTPTTPTTTPPPRTTRRANFLRPTTPSRSVWLPGFPGTTPDPPKPQGIADLFSPSEQNQVDRFIAYILYPQLFRPRLDSNTGQTILPGLRPTTPPPYYPAEMIADDGVCTPFQKVENTRAPGGQLLLNVDVDECKRMCLRDDACAAVDHNPDGDLCITHDALDMAMYTRTPGEGCCDHFHKTHCRRKSCYSHGIQDISGPDSVIIENLDPATTPPDGVHLQECSGGCIVEEIILISGNGTMLGSRQMSRGCLPGGLPFGKLCVSDQRIFENGDQLYTVSCDCGFDRCNALGQSALQGLALHMPFDGNTLDYSGSIRHAVNSGVQFDSALRMRNVSAYFDGHSYAIVTSFVGYLPGVISGRDAERTPSLTITAWFRRQGDSDDVMTILSNGVIELWSEHKGEMQNIRASVMLEDGIGYQVQGLHELDTWVFVVMRVTYGATPEAAELQLFLNDFELATNVPHNTLQLPAMPLMQSIFPLYIGKHPLEGNYFQGFLDELFVFSDALGSKQIITVRDLVKSADDETDDGDSDSTPENENESNSGPENEFSFEMSIDG